MPARRLLLETALLPDGWADQVALDVEDGIIRAVTPGAPQDGREIIRGIALPGLPNLHSHTFQRAIAGRTERRGPTADDFWTWREAMYAALDRMDPDQVEAVAALAFMEMLESGFTAVAEFHYLHHAPGGTPYDDPAELSARIAAAAQTTGIGLTLLPVLYSHGSFGAAPPAPGQVRFVNDLDAFARLHERAAKLPGITLGAAPHSLRAVTEPQLRAIARFPGPLHIHVAEQQREVDDCLAWSGQRPVEYLLDHAPVDDRWCLIHATRTTDAERAAIARAGAVVGLCPITEANLGDGPFDATAYAGRYGVGTDSNVEITAPGELRQLEYSQRLARRARNVLAAPGASTGRTLYEAACAGGAQTLAQPIGRLAPGHRADLVTLDRRHPTLAAITGDTALDAYIFSAGPPAIDQVFVEGRPLVTAGRHHARERIRRAYTAAITHLLRT